MAGRGKNIRATSTASIGEYYDQSEVLDYSGSNPDSYSIRVKVPVSWKVINIPKTSNPQPLDSPVPPITGETSYILTYDRLSKQVVKVEQPSVGQLNASKVYEALNLPVPDVVTVSPSLGGSR